VWINVAANPTVDWIGRQITEAFPWDQAPQHIIGDRDGLYGTIVIRRTQAIRRECLDHLVERGPSEPNPQSLRRPLQSHPYPSCARKGHPSWPSRAGRWIAPGNPPSQWTRSRIHPDGLMVGTSVVRRSSLDQCALTPRRRSLRRPRARRRICGSSKDRSAASRNVLFGNRRSTSCSTPPIPSLP
jgi:hypothetical protein